MSKTYQTAAIATKIADRQTKAKGEEYIAIEKTPGSWVVMSKEAVDNLVNEVGAKMQETPLSDLIDLGEATELQLQEVAEEGFSLENTLTDEEEAELDKGLAEQAAANMDKHDPQPKAKKVDVSESITVTLPAGSYEKGGYVYTPAIDGKPRWFATKNLLGLALEGPAVKITITRKALKARGLTEDMLAA
jgi:hypothetical protein